MSSRKPAASGTGSSPTALELDGTCSGEHGIGIGKLDALERELGEGVSVMRDIKRALDPDNIMNPGKVVRL